MNAALILFSAASFLAYGLACFFSTRTQREFVRYHLGALRGVVGVLQILGALGLLLGFAHPWLGQVAAGSFTVMMLLAVGVRIRIKDTLLQTLPALFYTGLNAYLCLAAF